MNEQQIETIINNIDSDQESAKQIQESTKEILEALKKNNEIQEKLLEKFDIVSTKIDEVKEIKTNVQTLTSDSLTNMNNEMLSFNITVVFLLGFICSAICIKCFIGGFQDE